MGGHHRSSGDEVSGPSSSGVSPFQEPENMDPNESARDECSLLLGTINHDRCSKGGKPKCYFKTTSVKKLYEVCKVSLSEKGPLSSEATDKVRAVLDKITPSDVGLECEAQAARVWRSPQALSKKRVFPSSPAIRYRHIYECKSFSIGIFCMPASSIIPLHNHPGMTVLSKVLYGTVHVKSYDWIDKAEPLNLLKVRPAKVVRDGEMSAPCGAMVLHPEEGGNIHALKAITPCAILDILTPPYSSEAGRHCSYFRRCPKSDPSGVLLNRTKGSEFVWLEEYQPRDSFVIRRDLYTGPALEL